MDFSESLKEVRYFNKLASICLYKRGASLTLFCSIIEAIHITHTIHKIDNDINSPDNNLFKDRGTIPNTPKIILG